MKLTAHTYICMLLDINIHKSHIQNGKIHIREWKKKEATYGMRMCIGKCDIVVKEKRIKVLLIQIWRKHDPEKCFIFIHAHFKPPK